MSIELKVKVIEKELYRITVNPDDKVIRIKEIIL